MLICLLLCATAVSTVFSDQVEVQNGILPGRKVHELVRRDIPSSYLTPTRFRSVVGRNSDNPLIRITGDIERRRLDSIGGGHLLKRATLDSIGGGHLLKRDMLDSIGGGNLLKRDMLDSIGGGNLLKRDMLDSIGGGNLLKRDFEPRHLDSIGGGHLLKRDPLNSMSGSQSLIEGFDPRQLYYTDDGDLPKRVASDYICADNLLKRSELRQLDSIGGGHLLKRDSVNTLGSSNVLRRDFESNNRNQPDLEIY